MPDDNLIDEITERVLARLQLFVECGADRIGVRAGPPVLAGELARYIDHTLLRPDATGADIEQLCREALQFRFATVCINPAWVRQASHWLRGSSVKVCSVCGFPMGATLPDVKAYEARRCIATGASEIDMVINVGALKEGEDARVGSDIEVVVAACHALGARCKVILETAFLSAAEKVKACTLAKKAGADFVKTSTGFGPGGATAEDVVLLRRTVGPALGVKAAGGIKDSETARRMIEAGATRIGASAGVRIVQDLPAAAGGNY